jgi:hypothetical protein
MPPGLWSSTARLRIMVAILCGLGLAACSSSRHENPDEPPNARGLIIAYKGLLWRDLESIKNASIAQPQRQAGVWRVCVRLDTKGPLGTYTGERDYLVAVYTVVRRPELLTEDAAAICGPQPHVPFPELEGTYEKLDNSRKAKAAK